MGDWHDDPTIISMLVMLDAIKDKFADIDGLWDLLVGKEERIVFFFLPLAENGLSDELYIKMNSRGKKNSHLLNILRQSMKICMNVILKNP